MFPSINRRRYFVALSEISHRGRVAEEGHLGTGALRIVLVTSIHREKCFEQSHADLCVFWKLVGGEVVAMIVVYVCRKSKGQVGASHIRPPFRVGGTEV